MRSVTDRVSFGHMAVTTQADLSLEILRLRAELEDLRMQNQRLRRENRELRATLDAHVARARSTRLFGPIEMTAGTCVGPRRARS